MALGVLTFTAAAGTANAAPKKKPPSAVAVTSEFDKGAASTAIREVSLKKCQATNAPRGEGHVKITFVPAGEAQSAQVDQGPWIGTPVAKCIQNAFKKVKVPAFKGEPVTVGKTFQFE